MEYVLTSAEESRDKGDVEIKPCIINQAFVNVLMAGMKQMMDTKFASIGNRR